MLIPLFIVNINIITIIIIIIIIIFIIIIIIIISIIIIIMFFFWGESSLFLFYPVVVQGCWVIAEQGRCLWHCRQAWVKLEDELVKLNQFLSCYIRQIAATRFIQFEIKSCFIFFSWISSDDACVVEIQDTAFLRGKLYSIIILPSFQFFPDDTCATAPPLKLSECENSNCTNLLESGWRKIKCIPFVFGARRGSCSKWHEKLYSLSDRNEPPCRPCRPCHTVENQGNGTGNISFRSVPCGAFVFIITLSE